MTETTTTSTTTTPAPDFGEPVGGANDQTEGEEGA
jgi:hypothetical protein